jgi:plasmid stability protein
MEPFRNQDSPNMPTTLSIKNAPDEIVTRLKQRAANNHRSLQGELMAIIEAAAAVEPLTPKQFLARVRRLNLHTSSDSVDIIRADRERDDVR